MDQGFPTGLIQSATKLPLDSLRLERLLCGGSDCRGPERPELTFAIWPPGKSRMTHATAQDGAIKANCPKSVWISAVACEYFRRPAAARRSLPSMSSFLPSMQLARRNGPARHFRKLGRERAPSPDRAELPRNAAWSTARHPDWTNPMRNPAVASLPSRKRTEFPSTAPKSSNAAPRTIQPPAKFASREVAVPRRIAQIGSGFPRQLMKYFGAPESYCSGLPHERGDHGELPGSWPRGDFTCMSCGQGDVAERDFTVGAAHVCRSH